MNKKLCMLLIFSKLKVPKLLIDSYAQPICNIRKISEHMQASVR